MSISRPLFSILIPTYNRAHLVGTAIRSVLDQGFDDAEIVVSDNYSIDGTEAVVRAFADERIRLIRPAEHCPLPQNWETARRAARGELLLVLSDDDALTSNALRTVAEVAKCHPSTTIVGLQAEYFSDNFPGEQRNTLNYERATGEARLRPADWFLRGLFKFKWPMDTHPTGWFWPRRVVERVVDRTGGFWATNGAELFAIPSALAIDPKLVTVQSHVGVKGRAPESIGTKLYFTNPGEEVMDEMIADTEKRAQLSPVEGFSYANLYSEGLWAARAAFIGELGTYPRDVPAYVDYLAREIRRRNDVGVSYGAAEKQVQLLVQAFGLKPRFAPAFGQRVRSGLVRRIRPEKYSTNGDFGGFSDMLGAARFVSKHEASARSGVSGTRWRTHE